MIGDRLLRMLMAAALGLLAASLARPAAAHPMGNFSINHYAAIAVAADRIEVR